MTRLFSILSRYRLNTHWFEKCVEHFLDMTSCDYINSTSASEWLCQPDIFLYRYCDLWPLLLMPQWHQTTDPVRFLVHVLFIARQAEWSVRRNFTPVLFSRLARAVHLWFDRIIRMTPHGPRAMPAWKSLISFISCGTHTGPVWNPQKCPHGTLTDT